MIVSDQQREENYQEYLQLLDNPDYYDVTFDEKSGGVSAVHVNHIFDKQIGPWGYSRGQYEKHVASVLKEDGRVIILQSERNEIPNQKAFDAIVDTFNAEIKTIEGDGSWAVATKIYLAAKQNADMAILYFPDASLFSHERVEEGWSRFLAGKQNAHLQSIIRKVLCVVENRVVEIIKPSG